MDTARTNASQQGQIEPRPQPANTLPRTTHTIGAHAIVAYCMSGAVAGFVLAIASMVVPYNRIAVFPQRYDLHVIFSSVRMKDPGFLILHIEEDGGLQSGMPVYLNRGYYRNLVVPIDWSYITLRAPETLRFAARLYRDNGDGEYYEQDDPPAKGLMGRDVSRAFGMHYAAPSWFAVHRDFFFDVPLMYLYDVFLP